MGFRRLIGHLLVAFAIIGLVAAPLVRPAAAMAPSDVAMTAMASMSGDMPCCPDAQNSKDCKDCPLLAICVVKNLATHPAAATIVMRSARHCQFAVHDDLASDGLDRPPPDHPPRPLV
jgi:hypothetical protein